jgi:hypothetical protein
VEAIFGFYQLAAEAKHPEALVWVCGEEGTGVEILKN